MKLGLITAEMEEAKHLRAFLNGRDVSDRCSAAHEQKGWVLLYKVDEKGHIISPVETVKKYGDVRLEHK